VETLAHVAWIHRNGAAEFKRAGTRNSPGTGLFTVLDHNGGCTLLEVPLGTRLVEVLRLAGVDSDDVSRLLLGGWFGGIHGPEVLGLEACFTTLKVAGSGLGCASISVIGHHDDANATVAELGAWYAKETAGQCGVCRNGTKGIATALARNAAGSGTSQDLEDLARWGVSLTGRGACAFIDGAASLARTTVAVVSAKTYMQPIREERPTVVAEGAPYDHRGLTLAGPPGIERTNPKEYQ
jgi:NADH:ubiquinone oxidoreductase subunit F (NADH-binding)